MPFKRISELVNPYAGRLFDYPGVIYPCFDLEKDKEEFRNKVFAFSGDLLLEYGSGSGNHLIEVAARNPESLCIGFEIRFKRAVRTIEKANEKGLTNIIIFRSRGELIPELFDNLKIKAIFINFPDPWDKKRWFKHRVLKKTMIDSFYKLLSDKGYISIKTDHYDYFKDFISEYDEERDLHYKFHYTTEDLHKALKNQETFETLKSYCADIKSEFEKLFESQKKEINYCLIKARSS